MPDYQKRAPKPKKKEYAQVVNRTGYLKAVNDPYMLQRSRIRKLADGGAAALDVLLKDLPTNDDTELAVNHIKSGIERFSEMISPPPDLRIDAPDHNDDDKPARAAEKRERIVASFDENCNLEGQLEQASMWLPGYGFFAWKVCEARDRNGYHYPKAELRDPYSTWPAEWGVDQKPQDIAFQRFVDKNTLVHLYPHAKAGLNGGQRLKGGAVDLSTFSPGNHGTRPGWDGVTGGVEVIEYVDAWGTYIYSPAIEGFLDTYEHPLTRVPFVVTKRTSFNQQRGQFDDAIGAAAAIAKATLLQRIAMEDAVFAPVVVSGRMDGPFLKGRDSVNFIEGGDAKYLTQNLPYQAFQEVSRIEDYLRSMTGYSKQADGESPMSFVTGQGLEELGSSLARQVERYQQGLRRSLEELDSIRLEWDETAYGDERKPLEGVRKGAMYAEEYTPAKDIAGNWRTRRVYGLMSGLDDARRGVALLQYLGAGIIDEQTVQEQVRGIDNPQKVRDRLVSKRATDNLFMALDAMAQQGDPSAMAVMLAIKKNPKDFDRLLEEFFTAPEEEPAAPALPEQPPGIGEFAAAMGGGGGGGADVLTRLTSAGEAQGGVQTLREVGAA